MHKGAIFPLFYLPPIEFFNKLLIHSPHVFFEKFEHFPKQTYRNRATIYSPQGRLDLTVPVVRGSKTHTRVKDVRICYDFNWQRLHWMSIQSCYRSSAYFEFYEDDFRPFYEKRWDFLFDFNEDLLQFLLKALKLSVEYSYTSEFEQEYTELADYRSLIHPKLPGSFGAKPYYQVFEDRHSFIPNLSIIDLLFNQGPQSRQFL